MENTEILAICNNPWCKSHFKFKGEIEPKQCPKCDSFNNELSAGITWEDKKYEGSRWDGLAHPISLNIKRYIDNKNY